MNYQALYRKYRSKNFDEIAGQKVTVQILKNAIENNRISHAYLFYGPRGTGKTSIAKIFSRTINCSKPKNGLPCEKCDNCLASKNPECVDIIEIDAASNNGVDEIRELKNKISYVPSELKYKVYIIDEVHMLSTGAFNALLKTLEEPPEHAIFILATTELNKIPLTIISRCQTLEFKKIDDASMKEKLEEISKKEKIDIDDTGLSEIIKYSNGGLRDAIGLLEKAYSYTDECITSDIIKEISGNISDNELKEFIDIYNNKDVELIINKINEYYNEGIDLIKLANNLIDYLRNRMIKAKTYSKDICSLIEDLDATVTKMEKSENPKMLFEITLINNMVNNNESSNTTMEKTEPVKEKNKPLLNKEKIEETKNKQDDISNQIKEVRVGNTLYSPQKSIISNIRDNWNKIDDYAFDVDLGNIARMLSSDFKPVAASNTNLILVSKLNGISQQLNNDINSVEKIINKAFESDYKIICLNEEEWNNYRLEYKSNKEKFVFKEEPNNNKKENKSLKEKAKDLFED